MSLLRDDCGFQVLDLWHVLAAEDDQRDRLNAGHPGVADHLRIEGAQLLQTTVIASITIPTMIPSKRTMLLSIETFGFATIDVCRRRDR